MASASWPGSRWPYVSIVSWMLLCRMTVWICHRRPANVLQGRGDVLGVPAWGFQVSFVRGELLLDRAARLLRDRLLSGVNHAMAAFCLSGHILLENPRGGEPIRRA